MHSNQNTKTMRDLHDPNNPEYQDESEKISLYDIYDKLTEDEILTIEEEINWSYDSRLKLKRIRETLLMIQDSETTFGHLTEGEKAVKKELETELFNIIKKL